MIDFNRAHIQLKESSAFYADLNEEGDYKEAMKNLYNELRRAENPDLGLQFIFIVNLEHFTDDARTNTLYDKTFRSASGVSVYYDENRNFYSKPIS